MIVFGGCGGRGRGEFGLWDSSGGPETPRTGSSEFRSKRGFARTVESSTEGGRKRFGGLFIGSHGCDLMAL